MPAPERPEPSRQLRPNELPPELADFLRDKPFVGLLHGTDRGTVLVVKAPSHTIEGLRGRIPIRLQHAVYEHPAAPVIRTLVTMYDQPRAPLALETFINVGDLQQREDFAALAEQRALPMLFYDDQLRHQLSKRVRLGDPQQIRTILAAAEGLRDAILETAFDFDRAKAAVMEATDLGLL
jgi:hypothetical protein